MSTSLAKAYVQIIPSAEGIKGKISSVLGGEAGAAGDAAGHVAGSNLASKIKTVIAAAGIGTALKSALSEGADLQQSLGGVETLFKDNANKVIENAKNAYKTAGMSANEYMETVTSFSASLLQGLSGDTSKAADVADMALTDMSDNANKMGTSMESIQNAYQGFAKQNYTMLDNLKLGYGGTKTEMERLLADASKLSGVKYDIGNLGDVYSAIHVIQGEMEISGRTADEVAEIAKNTGRTVKEQLGTTAKEGATTFSGSLASMKAALSNVLGNLALGQDISSSLYELQGTVLTFITGNLIPMIGNVLSSLPEVLEQTLTIATLLGNSISKNADVIVQEGINLLTGLISGIVSALPYLAETAIEIVTSLGSALINTDWTAVASGLITTLKDNTDQAAGEILGADTGIVDAVMTAINTNLPKLLREGISIITNLVSGILQALPTVISSAGTIISRFLSFIMQNLPAIWSAGVTLILRLVNGIIQSLPQIVSAAVTAVVRLASTILTNAPRLIQSGISLIGKLAAGLIQAIPTLLSKIPRIISDIKSAFTSVDWGSLGSEIINGIIRGITNCASSIYGALKEMALGALKSAKNTLEIKSPSRKFKKQVGEMIPLGIAGGIDDKVGVVFKSLKSLSNDTTKMMDVDFNYQTSGIKGISGNNSNQAMLETLIQYLANAIAEMSNKQAAVVKESLSNIRMIPNEREFVRFLNDLGYARG